MKFPFFASFIVFCIWLGYELHKHRNIEKNSMDDFWEKEAKANSTRKKSLDTLQYITIPFDSLNGDLLSSLPQTKQDYDTLCELAKEPIVNLTGISNTDLKLTYGAANITLLSTYDQRYTTLARTLQSLGESCHQNGYLKEACAILEFAVQTRTDVSATYKLLITLYRQLGQSDKIATLLPIAESLNSGLKNHIVTMIKQACDEETASLQE